MTQISQEDLRFLLEHIAHPHSMPQMYKLDALGIDVDVTTLPTWSEINARFGPLTVPYVEILAKKLAQDAMWRAVQQLAQTMVGVDET